MKNFDRPDSLGERPEDGCTLQSCEWRTETQVDSRSEREMRRRITVDDEPIGILAGFRFKVEQIITP